MIQLLVNGKPVELPEPTPLLDYLAGLGVAPRTVAVEIDGRILDRSEFAGTSLTAGAVVEIVRMVGGGGSTAP
jgi:thiamine biosynthesis protein ThiS